MSYFYIKINDKEEINLLSETVELIKENCLKDTNKYSIMINRKEHSNCLLDKKKEHLNVYEQSDKFILLKENYKTKYSLSENDISILLEHYNKIDINSIEKCLIQVKINYNNFLPSLALIIDLLGKEESLNKILRLKTGAIFNQIITNNEEYESAIIENNYIYYANFDNGSYIKKEQYINNNDLLKKYYLYRSLNDKLKFKNKENLKKI